MSYVIIGNQIYGALDSEHERRLHVDLAIMFVHAFLALRGETCLDCHAVL